MNRLVTEFLTIILAMMFIIAAIAEAEPMNKNQILSGKQQGIVLIAAFTAKGNLEKLKVSLNEGLDTGLTVNEIKEILVQLYVYTGFPRSLNGIDTFMTVMEERQKKGIKDEIGREANPLPANKSSVELGTDIQSKLVGKPVSGAIYTFAPAIDQFLKGHLFGDIFGRDNLDFQSREIATISALASMTGVTPQLQAHFSVGFNTGLSEVQMRSLVTVLADKVGRSEADNANEVLDKVLNSRTAAPERTSSRERYVRLAEIDIDPAQLESYKAAVKEEIETSVRVEPGVLALYAVAEKDNPGHILVFEIYADQDAYKKHIDTPHFKTYKSVTQKMVKSLKLVDTVPIILGTKSK